MNKYMRQIINFAKHKVYCLADDELAQPMGGRNPDGVPTQEQVLILAIARLEKRIEELEKRL